MPPGRPPGSATPHVRVRDLCLLTLIIPLAAAALQKQPQYHPRRPADDIENSAPTGDESWRSSIGETLHQDVETEAHRGRKDTHVHQPVNNNYYKYEKARTSHVNERALATVSTAESHPAVRAPPAQWASASSSAGLTSRQPARSLQDWKVEDIMLLATVDGKLHARERRTGKHRWTLEAEREMVETIRHPHNKTYDENGYEQEDPLFIVEPCQDGAIYAMMPEFGLQKLPYTVKTLAELSPFAGDGHPAVTYTAEKKNTLYTVDAATGRILKIFTSTGSLATEDQSCRRVNPLENPLDALEDTECEPIGTLTLARTEYTIGIQNKDTSEPISTIKYFEWAPNNRDNDLRSKYVETQDNRYIYSRWDGRVMGLDLEKKSDHKAVFVQSFSSPVVRVFDIMRHNGDSSGDASLVLLPQPAGPPLNGLTALEDDIDPVYVNQTQAGNWYAMSEKNYPSVTEKAKPVDHVDVHRFLEQNLAGVYNLPTEGPTGSRNIDGSMRYTIDAPPAEAKHRGRAEVEAMIPSVPSRQPPAFNSMTIVIMILALLVGGGSVSGYAWWKNPELIQTLLKKPSPVANVQIPTPVKVSSETLEEPLASPTFVREDEPAKEIIFPHENNASGPKVQFAEPVKDAESPEKPPSEEGEGDEDEAKDEADTKAPKKKATRGRRAGKKQREKEQLQAEARAKKNGSNGTSSNAQQVISVAVSESQQVAGPLQINSLVIHTDKVIGQGSCGTIVFEGSFEGRDVAVKRMLSQYYELASQEVSFLQQSDDHPNVVRYFCQQKDDHFLYIAVELCQASLFEVWENEKAKTDERRAQLQSLKLLIQQDMARTLQQLAEGLCHLHKLRIIHRDIKPQNVLVAFPKRTQPAGSTRLVISDFGLGKNLPENVSTLVDPTGNAGTSGWKAPELISQPRETESNHSQRTSTNGSDSGTSGVSGVKRAADIFSLGCLFFWVLTDGVHPFEDENGWQQLRELNIKRDKKNMDALERWSDAYEPMQLISSMLSHQPEYRPTAQAVLNHPYFWSAEKRLAFLCDCSDHFEREPRGTYEDGYAGDSIHLQLLEDRMKEVIGDRADFLAKLDRAFVDTLGKQRKYSGNRLLDLLRALRNKKNHYEDMPEDVKKRVGPLAAGYLNYWSNRFPRLLMACYEVVHEAKLQGNDRFKGYFGLGSD